MLEIQGMSNWKNNTIDIIMKRNKEKVATCEVEISDLEDGEVVLKCLHSALDGLVNACYPEMRDPLWRMQNDLKSSEKAIKELKKRVEYLKEKISILQEPIKN